MPKMKLYRVYGEYGPQAHHFMEREYVAQNPETARLMFETWMKRGNPWLWEHRMGSRNVHVQEIKEC